MLTAYVKNPAGLGRIIRDKQNNIIQIIEEKDATSEQRAIEEINSGIYLVSKILLDKWIPNLSSQNSQNEYYLTDIVAMAVKDHVPIYSIPVDEYEIQGINTRVQLAAVERQIQLRKAEQYMLNGVTLVDPNRFDVRGDVEIHPDVTIDINVILEGLKSKTIIESDVIIEPNVIIRNSHVKAGSKILANSVIESAVIHNNCQVGPFARIRPGTILQEEAKIGNFVEIKQSTIGAASKVNHLSYIGDAEIGMSVNIGAGTITCNYDGANKYKTTIEDNVFIGSGTQLIAPVIVGKGATIAAGTTLTKDAEAGKLTLTQKVQKTILDWVRPSKTTANNK
jgi:bifunctional UDP-N-acetylglucosamine pyrophosphorylase/glucosamine-1-phosphate N-acetyltransferase